MEESKAMDIGPLPIQFQAVRSQKMLQMIGSFFRHHPTRAGSSQVLQVYRKSGQELLF